MFTNETLTGVKMRQLNRITGLTLATLATCALPFVSEARRGGRQGVHQQASYFVPTNAALEPYARHEFTIKWESTTPGSRSFEYHLPLELDGISQEIVLQEIAPLRFEGPHASANCSETPGFTCRIKYRELKFDTALALAEIARIYPDPVVAEARGSVMKIFRNDPEAGGVLTVQ